MLTNAMAQWFRTPADGRMLNLTRDQRRALVLPVSIMAILVVGAIWSTTHPQTPRPQ